MGKGILVFLMVGVVVVLVGIGWQLYNHEPGGLEAQDFSMPLINEDGTLALTEHRGKVVVLNFWASWCTPCRDEAPRLQDVWEEYQDQEVVFIGVNSYENNDEGALALLDEFDLTFPSISDSDEEVAKQYNVYA